MPAAARHDAVDAALRIEHDEVGDPAIMRDFRVVPLRVFPLSYDAATRELRSTRRLLVEHGGFLYDADAYDTKATDESERATAGLRLVHTTGDRVCRIYLKC